MIYLYIILIIIIYIYSNTSSSSSGQVLSCETMLLFAASCRLIASMTPRMLDLLVNLVCFDVYSKTASKTYIVIYIHFVFYK